MTGCQKQTGSSPDAQVEALRLSAELNRTKNQLGAAEKDSAAKDDALLLAKEDMEGVKKQLAEREGVIIDKQVRIQALEAELAELKKRDAFAFAEVSKLVQQKLTTTALDHYRQFVKDYPTSPLVVDANRAIAELGVTAPREAKARAVIIDPQAPERDVLKKFAEGDAKPEELAPLLKNKSMMEVVRILGTPNKTYREGTELGYVDKISDPATGDRSTLVITFDVETKRVSTLRVGYAGPPIRP